MNDSVINKLQTLEVAPEVAQLSLFDGSVSSEFIINPEVMSYELRSNFSRLPVLATSQPLLWWQHSEAKVSFPDVKWLTTGNRKDLSAHLELLKSWTRPDPAQGVPRLLKFLWGEVSVPRCYIERLSYRVIQWRSGKPTAALGSLDLILSPEVPQAVFEEVEATLSEREQAEVAKQTEENGEPTNRYARLLEVLEDPGRRRATGQVFRTTR